MIEEVISQINTCNSQIELIQVINVCNKRLKEVCPTVLQVCEQFLKEHPQYKYIWLTGLERGDYECADSFRIDSDILLYDSQWRDILEDLNVSRKQVLHFEDDDYFELFNQLQECSDINKYDWDVTKEYLYAGGIRMKFAYYDEEYNRADVIKITIRR